MVGHKLLGVYRAGELLVQPLGDSGLYTALSCPSVFSTEVLNSMYSVLIVMLTISVILCVLVASRLGRNMTRPIERMNTAMRTLQEGDLTVRIVSDREDELGQMSRNFNIMANELEQSVQDKVEKQKELNASHIAMMQAQLNPHFLYNTLDMEFNTSVENTLGQDNAVYNPLSPSGWTSSSPARYTPSSL
jgi:two-component system, sensor histidine kinase YesM